MHGKISDENISPTGMIDVLGKHHLVLHGLLHIRIALRFNGISYIPEILAGVRQSIHQIDKCTVFLFLGCVEISDTCGCFDTFQCPFASW